MCSNISTNHTLARLMAIERLEQPSVLLRPGLQCRADQPDSPSMVSTATLMQSCRNLVPAHKRAYAENLPINAHCQSLNRKRSSKMATPRDGLPPTPLNEAYRYGPEHTSLAKKEATENILLSVKGFQVS